MKVTTTMHGIECNGCNQRMYEIEKGYAWFHLPDTLQMYLEQQPRGWVTKGDKHYCPTCVETLSQSIL